ncbi:ribosome maturation factor RimM [Porticoccus sp.]|uniref:ribosome maturation factor RimM n=1 Tax=Porticoccus sp. TaxID=2024853 RepID=UPI003F69FA99
MSARQSVDPVDPVVIGRITAVHGVKGWLKIHSFTEPSDNIFDYQPWWLNIAGNWQKMRVTEQRFTAKGLMVHLAEIDDRDQARVYCQRDIYVAKKQLPVLDDGQYYWHQLEGMTVLTSQGIRLGIVESLMETGANDVLIVKGDDGSLDQEERLIPYTDQFVLNIDLGTGMIEVDWDPAF